MMTRIFQFTRCSTAVLIAVVFMSSQSWALQTEISSPRHPGVDRLALWDGVPVSKSSAAAKTDAEPMRPIDRKALLGEEYRDAVKALTADALAANGLTADALTTALATEALTVETPADQNNDPIPFSISTMADDVVPPFAGFPTLTLAAEDGDDLAASFKENLPVDSSAGKVESVDDCCRELTEMIAGNLDSKISLDAKKRMIETALKMIARNVALKAEAKITKLKANHALEMAHMQNQIGRMRSTSSAVDQINRIAGPLSQILQKNYQQAVAMNLGNQQLAQSLAQLGYQQIEQKAWVARANRQRIQLTTPSPTSSPTKRELDDRNEQLMQQVARLQQQLDVKNSQPHVSRSNVQSASWHQPLQPRRQPLEPMRRSGSSENFSGDGYLPSARHR